jgi:hypothetical protein
MALEFNKVFHKVQNLGRWASYRDPDLEDSLDEALALFEQLTDLNAIHARIKAVRASSISGYRGAAPLDAPYHEVVCQTFERPPAPSRAVIVASDGSQIYPDRQSYPRYYLLNIGVFTYYHGIAQRPDQETTPLLYFTYKALRDNRKRLISRQTVDARRTVKEIEALAFHAPHHAGDGTPVITLVDNRLLFFVGNNITGGDKIMAEYRKAMIKLRKIGAVLAGYVDEPRESRQIVRLIHLMNVPPERLQQVDLRRLGRFEVLSDVQLMERVLKPGERSALMVQNSPGNLEFREKFGKDFEIAFFFINVSMNPKQPHIARIDIPMWVARDQTELNNLHALIMQQCAIQGANPYPYAITRADELAVVKSKDKKKLDELIRLEMLKNRVAPRGTNVKQHTKTLARGEKRRHEMK